MISLSAGFLYSTCLIVLISDAVLLLILGVGVIAVFCIYYWPLVAKVEWQYASHGLQRTQLINTDLLSNQNESWIGREMYLSQGLSS